MSRLFNFCAGPSFLPEPVLQTVSESLLEYKNSGIGVMELSHRGKHFDEIIDSCEARLRALLGIPEGYSVLFTTGGATQQFSMVPLNLLSDGSEGQYILTDYWSEKAFEECTRLGRASVAASSKDRNFSYIPKELQLQPGATYLHFTSNNTIAGTQFHTEPERPQSESPQPENPQSRTWLVCDASSDILSRKIDVSRYGIIYAGAQKNIGISGITVVIGETEFLERHSRSSSPQTIPLLLDYRTYTAHRSLYNTPPTFPLYVMGEVLRWIEEQGGVSAIEEHNKKKAQVVYDAIDKTPELYIGSAAKEDRSLMNATFRLPSPELDERFLAEAHAHGLRELKGHRMNQGIRVSMYNAQPLEAVTALAGFMDEFAGRNG